MNLNDFLFLAPEVSSDTRALEDIIWIPRNFEQVGEINALVFDLKTKTSTQLNSIETPRPKFAPPAGAKMVKLSVTYNDDAFPCLYLPYSGGSDTFLVYFHGNSEDVDRAYEFNCNLRDQLQVNVIALEYPGYGVYVGTATPEQILEDAETLFDYLQNYIGIPPENIIIFGRSIGTGPATYIASRRNPGVLILMSPYTSIKEVVRGVAGKLASLMVADQFRNIDEISSVLCPTFFLHGKRDTLIPYTHSVELSEKVAGFCGLSLPENMTHGRFFMDHHITLPILSFIGQCQFQIKVGREIYRLPKKLYNQPESLKVRNAQKRITYCIRKSNNYVLVLCDVGALNKIFMK